MDNIDTLRQNIITSFGLDSLSADEQARVLEDVGTVIYQRVILRVLDTLSEADKDEFDTILGRAGNNEQAITSFLDEKVPNLDELVEEEINGFKSEARTLMEAIASRGEKPRSS